MAGGKNVACTAALGGTAKSVLAGTGAALAGQGVLPKDSKYAFKGAGYLASFRVGTCGG